MKRRSFFKTIAAIVAAVAIAPEVAFRRKLELPTAEPEPKPIAFWWEAKRSTMCVDAAYEEWFKKHVANEYA